MSNIKVQQISETEVEVSLSPETPMEMVNQLEKGLNVRGFVEDLTKSTISIRRFYRPQDGVNKVADQLIKSLQQMTKGSDSPKGPSMRDLVRETNLKNRLLATGQKQAFANLSNPNQSPSPSPISSPRQSGPSVLPPNPNKLFKPGVSSTEKSEHLKDCSCRECKEMRKNEKIKKSERELNWNQDDLDKVATNFARAMSSKLVKGTEVGAQLSDMYKNKIKLQPTDEELFGQMVVSEEQVQKAESNYANSINNFYAEASKPISQRFASEEEELAYWNSIKVNGSDGNDGSSGY